MPPLDAWGQPHNSRQSPVASRQSSFIVGVMVDACTPAAQGGFGALDRGADRPSCGTMPHPFTFQVEGFNFLTSAFRIRTGKNAIHPARSFFPFPMRYFEKPYT
jgi:hypothetical protein